MLASPLLPRPLALIVICAVTACSTKRQAPAHPPLALHHRPTREIQSLFLSGREFQKYHQLNLSGLKNVPQRTGRGLVNTVTGAGLTGAATFLLFAGGADLIPTFLAGESSTQSWFPDCDETHSTSRGNTVVACRADDIVHARLPETSEGTFVRLRGNARVKVTDEHGSYYARADEIQFRPDLQAVLLRGRVSLSAVNAPDLKSFGLLRIDLARCQAFYTGSGS